jgi:hypothetical protein
MIEMIVDGTRGLGTQEGVFGISASAEAPFACFPSSLCLFPILRISDMIYNQ